MRIDSLFSQNTISKKLINLKQYQHIERISTWPFGTWHALLTFIGEKQEELTPTSEHYSSSYSQKEAYMYKTVTVFCPRCGCRTLEMLTTHSFCTECNYSPDTDHHVHLHDRDPIADDESAYEMDERSREVDLDEDDSETPSDADDEEEDPQKLEELKKLKQLVADGFLDPTELVDEYPQLFGENWYWNDEDEINLFDPDASEYGNALHEDFGEWSEEDSYQVLESDESPYDETHDEEMERAA